MKTPIFRFFSAMVISCSFLLYSCGPSSESQREQEIKDSILLEQERRELLNRASKVLENSEHDAEVMEVDSLDQ
jgi:hypothetical protein